MAKEQVWRAGGLSTFVSADADQERREAYHRGLPSNLALFPVENPLAAKLYQLAQRGVFIGTSSWKYPGWIGQVYTRERYTVRGRFSKAAFERDSLKEYAESFRTVCADFTFYQFPTETMLAGLFSDVPAGFQMAFKVTDEITVKTYPPHDRYGPRAGTRNPNFLNADIFLKLFLSPILPYRDRVVLIFEFGAFDANEFTAPAEFLEQLGVFLRILPRWVSICSGDPKSGVSGDRILDLFTSAQGGPCSECLVPNA